VHDSEPIVTTGVEEDTAGVDVRASDANAVASTGEGAEHQRKHLQAARERKKKKAKDKEKHQRKLNLETRPGSYHVELAAKVDGVSRLLGGDGVELPEVEVYESPPEHFRMRCEFDVWHDESGPSFVMFDGKARVAVSRYPMGDRRICDHLMPTLVEFLRVEEVLRSRLFQVNFHVTLAGDAMVSLLYHTPFARSARRAREQQRIAEIQRLANEPTSHRPEEAAIPEAAMMPGPGGEDQDDCPLTEAWEKAAAKLCSALSGASVVGHSRGRRRVVGRDWVQEHLRVAGVPEPLRYRQVEGAFSQPNAAVAQHMLSWARAVARDEHAAVGSSGPPRGDDLLELYCGNGHFAVALAPCFRRVLATELVKDLVDAARLNAEDNGAANVVVARVSAEELGQALEGTRSFQRLAHVDLADLQLRTVLVDPPRAGLGAEVSCSLSRFSRIVYISCNPSTLHADLETLGKTHQVRRVAVFDQFPYTEHLEMGVLLVRSTE